MATLIKSKALGYIRVSTRRQVRQGFSLSSQRQGIEKYTKANGLALKVCEDAGISGATMKRPGLQTVLNYIRFDAGVKCLVVYRLDRLSRNAADMLQIADECLAHDVQIVSLNESLSVNPNTLRSQIGIYGAVAEFQRSIIRENVMLGSAQRFEAGLPLSMKLPIGYKLDAQGQVVIDEATAPLVIEMFSRYISGIGYRKLADWLSDELGQSVSLVTISTMLINEHYMGVSKNSYGISYDIYPAIIDKKVYDMAQKHHQQRSDTIVRQTSWKGDMLYGKLECPLCHHRLGLNVTTIKGRQYSYYYCSMGKNVANQAQRHTFRLKAPDTRQAVLSSIRATVSKPEFIMALSCALDARLATLTAKAPLRQPASSTQLYRQFEVGKINSEELKDGLATLEKAMALKVKPDYERFRKALASFQKMGLSAFVQQVIDTISFDDNKKITNITPMTNKGGVAIE